MKYCINCGNKIEKSNKFCEKCGCKNVASLTVKKMILVKVLRKRILIAIAIIIGIIISIILVIKVSSMVDHYKWEKENNERFPKTKDYSIYMSPENISNPVYLQNKDEFLIDFDSGSDIDLLNKSRRGEAWVERILYYDKEKIIANFLVSYAYQDRGENIISFYLYPVQTQSTSFIYYFANPLFLGENQQECSFNVLKDMLDKIFVNKYVLVNFRNSDYSVASDIILKKQDVDASLLNGVTIIKCDWAHKSFCPYGCFGCFSNGSDMVSGLDLLVTNGYAHGKGFEVAKLAKKGVWKICQ